jgi:type IV pilus assembly protein PilF
MTRLAIVPTFALLLLSGLLVACASNPRPDDGETSGSARRAAELNTQLGQEYMARGQYEVALEKLKKAVASDDNYAPAHTMLAVLYESLGETDNAGRHFEAAVRADPSDGDVNNNYGAFLCRSGKPRGVDRYFETALQDPFYQTPEVAMANAGACALQRGDEEQGEKYLRQSLAYDPQFPDALLALAGLSYERSDLLRARAFLQRYDIAGEMTPQSLLLGYRIETDLNNLEQASRYRTELIQNFPAAPETAETQGGRSE